ncbi:MAG TPA: TIGR03013 family XrtA/PEP-CTERM system glycosyltransferase [Nitrospirota bacterium]|nr:TIGR03013 family XrtA/PEP-CTERM system glycosyltransferase [Nitrospirota bacterium]
MFSVFLLLIGDALLAVAGVSLGFLLRFGGFEGENLNSLMDLPHMLAFIGVPLFFSYLFELYNLEKHLKKRDVLFRSLAAVGVSFMMLASVYYMMPAVKFGRGIFAISLAIFWVLQFLWHLCFSALQNSSQLARRVLVLGTGPLAKKVGDLIEATNHQHVLKGYVDLTNEPVTVPEYAIVGKGSSLFETIRFQKAHKLVISLSERRGVLPLQVVLKCKMSGIEVVDAPSFYEELTGKLLIENITPSAFFFSDGFRFTETKMVFKRIFDILCSLAGLLITLPLFPLIAVLIKLDSRGTVFFRQKRVGEMEKEFMLYKFRTMREDAEKGSGAVWAEKNDPRVTRFGRFLRKTRLDELPQFYNVLRGDMSFIGPRPERPEFVKQLKEIIPFYPERHFVKPGLTGWAQIKYAYGASMEDAVEKLRYDLYYIKHLSLFLDMLVMLETIKVMLFGRGAR